MKDRPLYQYKPETDLSLLLRHHRIARRIIYPWLFFSILMCSSLAQGLLIGFDMATIVVCLVSTAVALLLAIPAVLCLPWMSDIEAEMAKRDVPVPGGQDIDQKIPKTVGKMMLWAILIVVGPGLLRKVMYGW